MYNFGPGLHQSGELFDILSAAGYIADASGHVLGKMALGEYMAVLVSNCLCAWMHVQMVVCF